MYWAAGRYCVDRSGSVLKGTPPTFEGGAELAGELLDRERLASLDRGRDERGKLRQ